MKPFAIPDSCAGLRSTRLSAHELLAAARGGKEARIILAQQWMTEGIPFAFAECPAVYGAIRIWLGCELGIHAKQIGLTGSSRHGEALNPQKFGQPFGKESDLDFYIVSNELFSAYRSEFFVWCEDYASGRIVPRNDREGGYWKDNERNVPRNISRGFIDVNKIPARAGYGTTQRTLNLMSQLIRKLSDTPHSPSPCRASIRCYENWTSLIDRVSINLRWIAQDPCLAEAAPVRRS